MYGKSSGLAFRIRCKISYLAPPSGEIGDFTRLLRLVAPFCQFYDGFRVGDHDFLFAFYCNLVSNSNRLNVIQHYKFQVGPTMLLFEITR